MLEGVLCQRCMVCLDVQLEIGFKSVCPEEAYHCRCIKIILMLCGLLRLGLYQELTFKADLLRIVDCHSEEARHIVELQFHVGIEQCLISFPAAPEYIVLAAQFLRDLHSFFNLGTGICKYVSIGGCGSTVCESRMPESIGGSPQKLDTAVLHPVLDRRDDDVEPLIGFPQRVGFRCYVPVMETEKRGPELFTEFEIRFYLGLCQIHRIRYMVPGSDSSSNRSERIGSRSLESVPVCHGKPQMILHPLAGYYFVCIVVFECQRVVGAFALILDFLYTLEILSHNLTSIFLFLIYKSLSDALRCLSAKQVFERDYRRPQR